MDYTKNGSIFLWTGKYSNYIYLILIYNISILGLVASYL